MLSVSVSPEVFKVVDPRVDKLRSGRLSAEQFARMIGPEDPFLLIDGVIHAMSEVEFYASRAAIPVNRMSERGFNHVLELTDLSFMQPQDRAYVEKVKSDLPHCSACRYKRYKEGISGIARKYRLEPVNSTEAEKYEDTAKYPETTAPVASVVSVIHRNLFHVEQPGRRPCLDCVEKHVSQAYVLSGEVVCGYPEHMALVVAHLSEALDELPDEASALKDTLMFCLAKTRKDKVPFVPRALLSLINAARAEQTEAGASAEPTSEVETRPLNIELDVETKDQMSMLYDLLLRKVRGYLTDAMEAAALPEPDKLAWEGCLSCASECLANTAPRLAQLIRNRRLIFIGDISLTAAGEYSFDDIVSEIDRCLENLN